MKVTKGQIPGYFIIFYAHTDSRSYFWGSKRIGVIDKKRGRKRKQT